MTTPAAAAPKVHHIQIQINGTDVLEEYMDGLVDVEVDSSMGMPDMAIIRFNDDNLKLINDASRFAPGHTLAIKLPDPNSTTNPPTLVKVFDGEITSLESNFSEDLTAMMIITAYDKSHRMNRETKVEVFVDVKDSDIVSRIVGQYSGIALDVEATTTVYKHVYQDNQTDRDFLEMLARRNGYVIFMDGTKFCFKKSYGTTEVMLEWGKTNTAQGLLQFRPRLSLSGQVDKASVRGWDMAQKQAILGQASSSTTHATTGFNSSGGALASSKLSAASRMDVRYGPISQADADKMAQGILDAINAESVEAEGVCIGNPNIKIGVTLKLTGLGPRFNGKYKPSTVIHFYTPQQYHTRFRVEGLHAKAMSHLLNHTNGDHSHPHRGYMWSGVVTALVTNNADTQNTYKAGHVKVKYPWMHDSKESFWARVAAPGAGANRGMMWLPEINDEVLVAFEQGDFNRPYILGGLWNGQDAPPETQIDTAVKSGKVEVRTLKTRIGHLIRMTDESGKEKIEILDGKSKTSIVMDTANEKITMKSSKDIAITADTSGKIDVKSSSGAITIESSSGGITVKASGGNVTVEGAQGVEVKSNASLTLKGATITIESQGTLDVKANGPATVQSTAILNLKGSMVKIGS